MKPDDSIFDWEILYRNGMYDAVLTRWGDAIEGYGPKKTYKEVLRYVEREIAKAARKGETIGLIQDYHSIPELMPTAKRAAFEKMRRSRRESIITATTRFLTEQKATMNVAAGHKIGYNLHKDGVDYYALNGDLYQVFDNHTHDGAYIASVLHVLENRNNFPEIAFTVGIQRIRELSTRFDR